VISRIIKVIVDDISRNRKLRLATLTERDLGYSDYHKNRIVLSCIVVLVMTNVRLRGTQSGHVYFAVSGEGTYKTTTSELLEIFHSQHTFANLSRSVNVCSREHMIFRITCKPLYLANDESDSNHNAV